MSGTRSAVLVFSVAGLVGAISSGGLRTALGLATDSAVAFNSLALGGAAIGSNALAVAGTVSVSSSFSAGGAIISSQYLQAAASNLILWNGRGILSSPAVGTIQLGNVDAATPVAQTLQAQGSRSGTDTNVAGANLTIRPGAGTGNATPSSLIFQTYAAVASGTGAQTATTRLTIDGTNSVFTTNVNSDLNLRGLGLYAITAAGASTGAGFSSASDGVLKVSNFAGTDLNRIQFGGTTSSFPALKRNGSILEARLADDSNYTFFTASNFTATQDVIAGNTTAITAGGSLFGLQVSSTANFGVFVGSGAPTITAAKGSLYLRSDGTTTNDRAYIATDSAGAWTPLTTAT